MKIKNKIINFFKNNGFLIFAVGMGVAVVFFLTAMMIHVVNEKSKYDDWYASLTSEEKLIEDKRKEDEYNKNIKKYEVVSVSKYIRNETNKFGGITDTKTCYSFSYIDNKGDIYHVDDFYHTEYGLWKVTIGNENLYIVNNNGETTRTLQLTEETYKKFN